LEDHSLSSLDGSSTDGSSVGLSSVEEEDNPLDEIYSRIQALNLTETPVGNSQTVAPTVGPSNTNPTFPSVYNNQTQAPSEEETTHLSPPTPHLPPASNTQQFELLIEDEIQNMESLTLHDSPCSLLSSIAAGQKLPRFFDSFMALLKERNQRKFNIAKADTRDTFIARMRKEFPCSVPNFVDIPVDIPSDIIPNSLKKKMNATNYVRVMKFVFREQLQDLLDDFSLFGDLDNLCVNSKVSDRFKPFIPGMDDLFLEVLGADWYQRTGQQLPSNEMYFLIPLIFYADKTGTDVNQRYSLEPWLFTLALFRRHIRENPDAWRYLGFIPDLHTIATKGMSAQEKMDLYHRCLIEILKDVVDLQKNPPLLKVRLGNQVKYVRAVLQVAFVMGDQKSNDNICCRKGVTYKAGRIHRGCMCSSLHADDPTKTCEWIEPKLIHVISQMCLNQKLNNKAVNNVVNLLPTDILKKQTNDYLKRQGAIAKNICEFVLSMYPVKNAFDNIGFGANPFGIFRAALDDTLHFSEAGYFQYLNQTIYDPLQPKECQRVDFLVESHLGKQTLRSSCRHQYPWINFTRGFSQLTLLTHSEKIGVTLATLVLLHTTAGRSLLDRVFLRQQLKFQGINLDNGNSGKPSKKELLQEILTNPDSESISATASATKATPKPKKGDPFPKTKRAYLFIVKQIKKHGLSIILHQTLDKLQLEHLFQAVWSECTNLYHHQHNKEQLEKRFPRNRVECDGIVYFDSALFQRMDQDLTSPVEKTMFTLVDIIPEGKHDCPIIDSEEDSSSDEELNAAGSPNLSSHEEDSISSDGDVFASTKKNPPNTAYTFVDNKENEESSDDEPLATMKTRLDGTILHENSTGQDQESASSDDEPLMLLKSRTPHLLKATPKATKKPLTQYPSCCVGISSKTKVAKGKKAIKKHRLKNGMREKKITPLQEYYLLNLEKPRQPIRKETRLKLSNCTGSTAAVLCDIYDFLELLEFTLCWHAFTKYEELLPYSYRCDSKAIDLSIRKMMELFMQWFYRGDNSVDTKTCKFHSHIHTVSNRLEYGSLLQYDTGKGERHLKHTKGLAATAQKRGQEVFTEQTCDRILDHFVLRRAEKVMDVLFPTSETIRKENGPSSSSLLRGKARFLIQLSMGDSVQLNSKGKPAKGGIINAMDPFVVEWLKAQVSEHFHSGDLHIWTEMRNLRDPDQNIYRAHPMYDHKGAWYDWAMINFEEKGKQRSVPAKLLGFFRGVDEKEYAVAHCCSWHNQQGGPIEDSLLCQHWCLEYCRNGRPQLTYFELEAIDQGCLIIEKGRDPKKGLLDIGTNKVSAEQQKETVIRIVARKDEWPIQFVKWGRELAKDPSNTHLINKT
jgi:hypothetical protein